MKGSEAEVGISKNMSLGRGSRPIWLKKFLTLDGAHCNPLNERVTGQRPLKEPRKK